MQRLVFWLTYPFLWFLSKLPFPIFYFISDVVFLLVYHVLRYRRRIVRENLDLVFPTRSSKEKEMIEKKFYGHMVDMFLEMMKSISISNEELKKRFVFTNLEEIDKIRAMDKSIILACGHYASFEWMNALQLYDHDYRGFGVYKKIHNPYFDKMARDIRGRLNSELITSRMATKTIIKYQKQGILGIYGIVADQSPRLERANAWTQFMGIRVPVFMGIENLSKKLDITVLYLHVEKVKRGFYEATFKPLSYNAPEEEDFNITKNYYRELEAQINAAPEYYLWTHKRWKHRNAPIPHDATIF